MAAKSPADTQPHPPVLARHIGLFALIAYGVGDMVGAGIYGTIGVAAAAMGNAVWIAFAASMVAAMLTGLSYASLASRYPRAAGAAYVTQRAFRLTFLSYGVGLSVMASGLTSMATSSNVFAQNLQIFMEGVPLWALILLFIGALTALNLWGIRESMWANILCTLVEVGGLIVVIIVGMRFWGSVNYLETPPAADGTSSLGLSLILSGAVLTFFSFVGFEDMLNVAEEVKEPERTMPWGMVGALAATTLLYIAISITAVSVVDYRDLGNKELGAPFAQIANKAVPWLSPWVYTAITLFAVANTALLNYVMGSRLAYGMARQKLLPQFLGRVHPGRRTPHAAILCLMVIALALALSGSIPFIAKAGAISVLAKSTALLLLGVFCIVNTSLVVLKLRKDELPGKFEIPVFIPLGGTMVCAIMIANAKIEEFIIAGILLIGIVALYLIMKPKRLEAMDEPEADHG